MRLALWAAALAVATPATLALPSVHSFRGASRYAAMYLDPDAPVPAVPNPRDDAEFYQHRSTEEYVSQGFGPSRPRWAQSVIDATHNLLDGIASDLLSLTKIGLPYFTGQDGLSEGFSRFTFHPDGDAEFVKVKTGASRFDIEGNATESALPLDSGFDYKVDKVRGVNLGNWLLFELWMDSKLSAALNNHAINAPNKNPIVDEWTAGLYSQYSWAKHVLEKHFDTWITEQDFIDIKNAGLNHVRIPFPYWAFAEAKGKNAPYLTLNRFDKLIEGCGWAKKHGLKVWVDIHSVPGSQNGFDNSGRAGPIHWANDPDYYSRTQYTFNRLATLFSQPEWKGTVTAVEAVNEPLATNSEAVKDLIMKYYPWARNAVAKPPGATTFTSLFLAMHDGFLGPLYWDGFFTGRASNRVLLDTHPYFVYTSQEKRLKDSGRLREVCGKESTFTRSQKNYPTIAGEMSISGPNGDRASDRDLPRGPVSFPDGQDYPYSTKYMAFMARNFAVQTQTFEKGAGWIFWAWKNRNALDWSYSSGVKYGWIPKSLDEKSPFGNDACADYR